MDILNNTILFKFGKKEHLESLKKGWVYFNPVARYRKDGSDFRGDHDEGFVPIDPSSVQINGKYFGDIIGKVRKSFVGDESTLMFCTSILNKEILTQEGSCFILSDEFKETIQRFGSHVLIINRHDFIDKLQKARNKHKPKFAFRAENIKYRDLNDFLSDDYHTSYFTANTNLDPFFVKSDIYKKQNEWRMIIGSETEESLSLNVDGSFQIYIGELNHSIIFETQIFLDTFKIEIIENGDI